MKPFTIPEETPGGKRRLALQWEGMLESDLLEMVRRVNLLEYSFPDGHSEEAAWPVFLTFDDLSTFEISSASTQISGWDEIGSINIRRINFQAESLAKWRLVRRPLEKFKLSAVEKLVFEEEICVSECGLALVSAEGVSVLCASGIPPGSVSVLAPGATAEFRPQFPLSICRREIISSGALT